MKWDKVQLASLTKDVETIVLHETEYRDSVTAEKPIIAKIEIQHCPQVDV